MKDIEKTLAEQMQINDREITRRKDLLYFTDQEISLLKEYRPFFEKYLDGIIKQFYEKQLQESDIALLIGDAETLRRLKGAMRRYILALFDGHYDADYVNQRLRIGKVHMRIGVSPKLYIAAIQLLQSLLGQAIDMHALAGSEKAIEAGRIKNAINKLLMFDITFVFDTYISSLVSEVTTAKNELEHYALSLEVKVAERTRQLEEMSRKDALTNLNNQRAFYEYLRRELASAERYKEPLTLAYFDLNGFKDLNDNSGHLEGDKVLEEVGRVLLENLRENDIPCRYGGDEFCIIFPRSGTAECKQICQRIIAVFEENSDSKISFSLGLKTTGPEDFLDSQELVRQADALMYQSKYKSRIKPGFYIETSDPVVDDDNVVSIEKHH